MPHAVVEQRAPSWREKYPALGFLMRHVDSLPNMSHTRWQLDLMQQVAHTAVGLAMAGETAAATRLLELLRDHGIDPLNHYSTKSDLQPPMYFAWHQTASWPAWVPQSERSEERLAEVEAEGHRPWLHRFAPEYRIDHETALKALDMAERNVNKYFPAGMSMPDKIRLIHDSYEQGLYGYAANPATVLADNLLHNSWWRLGTNPYPWMQLHRSAGLTIALDILLRLQGKEEEAEVVLRTICDRFTFTEQAQMLACSRVAWQRGIFARHDGDGRSKLLTLLEIDPVEMHEAALRAVDVLERRLADGPARPYKGKTVAELASILSANTFENGAYDDLVGINGSPVPDRPRTRYGLLRHPPCSASDLADLEARLGTDLPADYKELMSATDGMGAFWDGRFLLRLVAPAAEVAEAPLGDSLDGMELNLLGPHGGLSVKWPSLPAQVIALSGAGDLGGSRGDLWLVDREATAKAKAAFFEALDANEGAERARLEREAVEVYGSLERLRGLDRALIKWTSWEAATVPYDGLRGVLEDMAQRSMHKLQPWDDSFRPDKQTTLREGLPWSASWDA